MSSQNNVSVYIIDSVVAHPYADRLDIANVSGYNVVVQRGQFKAGDYCIYFPADTLIPETVGDSLGVTKYLKFATYPGDVGPSACRVGAARLRGVPSYGFIIPTSCSLVGKDLSEVYQAVRYDPPPKVGNGDQVDERPKFHRYTDIENVQRFPSLIPEGTKVVYTEKIHGANCRIGTIDGEPVAGSHRTQRANTQNCIYWCGYKVCSDLIRDLGEDGLDVIIFGEIFGPGVQDLHYSQTEVTFRAFDISVNGKYMDYMLFMNLCKVYGIPTVPVLEISDYSRARLEALTDGQSTLGGNIREGVVVKALEESTPRQILKSVSVDYLSRE